MTSAESLLLFVRTTPTIFILLYYIIKLSTPLWLLSSLLRLYSIAMDPFLTSCYHDWCESCDQHEAKSISKGLRRKLDCCKERYTAAGPTDRIIDSSTYVFILNVQTCFPQRCYLYWTTCHSLLKFSFSTSFLQSYATSLQLFLSCSLGRNQFALPCGPSLQPSHFARGGRICQWRDRNFSTWISIFRWDLPRANILVIASISYCVDHVY